MSDLWYWQLILKDLRDILNHSALVPLKDGKGFRRVHNWQHWIDEKGSLVSIQLI